MEALRDMHLPPGFGFHPSDAELISHYLKRKVHGQKIEYDLIPEVDIYKYEPWDLPEQCKLPIEDNKWHFFASRDRKYPTGGRSNRATRAGYWKSTGKDRAIKLNKRTLGTKKTLVFHEGRPPSGKRTEWIMHEYYIDERECQASLDMKDAFVLCRVTKREDWALENDNEVGNRNPHPQQLNDAATSDVTAEKQEDADVVDICAGEPSHVVAPARRELSNDLAKTEFAALAGICAEEHNHAAAPASAEAELSNDLAKTQFDAHSPNSDSELQAFLDELLVDLSSNSAMGTGSADLSLNEQNVVSSNLQNPGSVAPMIEQDYANSIQNGMDDTDGLTYEDFLNIYPDIHGFSGDFAADQMYNMMGMDRVTTQNNFQGTNEELQLYQGYEVNPPDENADNGITIRRRNVTASSAGSSVSTRRVKLQIGVNRMVTSNSETINETIKFSGNSGRMRSFRQTDATESSENLSSQEYSKGIKSSFRSSAGFKILFACICMIGVIAAALHGYYRLGINL